MKPFKLFIRGRNSSPSSGDCLPLYVGYLRTYLGTHRKRTVKGKAESWCWGFERLSGRRLYLYIYSTRWECQFPLSFVNFHLSTYFSALHVFPFDFGPKLINWETLGRHLSMFGQQMIQELHSKVMRHNPGESERIGRRGAWLSWLEASLSPFGMASSQVEMLSERAGTRQHFVAPTYTTCMRRLVWSK